MSVREATAQRAGVQVRAACSELQSAALLQIPVVFGSVAVRNSCWPCGSENDDGRLRTTNQVHGAYTGASSPSGGGGGSAAGGIDGIAGSGGRKGKTHTFYLYAGPRHMLLEDCEEAVDVGSSSSPASSNIKNSGRAHERTPEKTRRAEFEARIFYELVERVEFVLDISFGQRRRVVKHPPYVIKESAWGESYANIIIFFRRTHGESSSLAQPLSLQPQQGGRSEKKGATKRPRGHGEEGAEEGVGESDSHAFAPMPSAAMPLVASKATKALIAHNQLQAGGAGTSSVTERLLFAVPILDKDTIGKLLGGNSTSIGTSTSVGSPLSTNANTSTNNSHADKGSTTQSSSTRRSGGRQEHAARHGRRGDSRGRAEERDDGDDDEDDDAAGGRGGNTNSGASLGSSTLLMTSEEVAQHKAAMASCLVTRHLIRLHQPVVNASTHPALSSLRFTASTPYQHTPLAPLAMAADLGTSPQDLQGPIKRADDALIDRVMRASGPEASGNPLLYLGGLDKTLVFTNEERSTMAVRWGSSTALLSGGEEGERDDGEQHHQLGEDGDDGSIHDPRTYSGIDIPVVSQRNDAIAIFCAVPHSLVSSSCASSAVVLLNDPSLLPSSSHGASRSAAATTTTTAFSTAHLLEWYAKNLRRWSQSDQCINNQNNDSDLHLPPALPLSMRRLIAKGTLAARRAFVAVNKGLTSPIHSVAPTPMVRSPRVGLGLAGGGGGENGGESASFEIAKPRGEGTTPYSGTCGADAGVSDQSPQAPASTPMITSSSSQLPSQCPLSSLALSGVCQSAPYLAMAAARIMLEEQALMQQLHRVDCMVRNVWMSAATDQLAAIAKRIEEEMGVVVCGGPSAEEGGALEEDT